jgi:hypothetical protein
MNHFDNQFGGPHSVLIGQWPIKTANRSAVNVDAIIRMNNQTPSQIASTMFVPMPQPSHPISLKRNLKLAFGLNAQKSILGAYLAVSVT